VTWGWLPEVAVNMSSSLLVEFGHLMEKRKRQLKFLFLVNYYLKKKKPKVWGHGSVL
jgi:hypothetical protein